MTTAPLWEPETYDNGHIFSEQMIALHGVPIASRQPRSGGSNVDLGTCKLKAPQVKHWSDGIYQFQVFAGKQKRGKGPQQKHNQKLAKMKAEREAQRSSAGAASSSSWQGRRRR